MAKKYDLITELYAEGIKEVTVLGMEDWNRKFGRWVKHDSKAIAVFDKSGSTVKLKYYFDLTDTSEGRC